MWFEFNARRRFKHELLELIELIKENRMDLKALIDQVAATVAGEASAVVAFKALADAFIAHSADPVAVAKLAADLKTSADALGAAVAASPVQPPAPPPVVTP